MEELLELLKDPDVLGQLHEVIEVYKPPVYSLINEFVSIWKDFINSEYYDLNAAADRRAYYAYINAGFTEDQAMQLLLNHNLEVRNALNDFSAKINKRN